MTIQVDRLHLTEDGIQAIQNAEAGGILVNPKTFALGNFEGITTEIKTSLQGDSVFSGKISYIEVLTRTSVRITMDIPKEVGTYEGVTISEIIILSDSGITLAYGVIGTPYKKFLDRGLRIDVILHSTATELTTLNVTMSEFGSIPSVPNVDYLPNPVLAENNAVSVLDLIRTTDGKTAPGLACRHGEGGMKWGFYGHDRIFEGEIGAGNATSPALIWKTDVIEQFEIEDGTSLIIQVISGIGAGESRNFIVVDGSMVSTTTGFSDLSDTSVIAIWILIIASDAANSCPWPPEGDNIPEDWILKRGKTCPYWSPQGSTLPSNTRLYKRPSRLVMKHASVSSDSSLTRYPLGDVYPESGNYISMSMSGIENHRQGFEILDNTIEIPEKLPNNILLDFRMLVREPSSGTKLLVKSKEYIGDGTTVEFLLPIPVKNAIYVWAYVGHIKQGLVSYTTEGAVLTFTEAPPSGQVVELNCFYHEDVEGFSTDVTTVQYKTAETTNIIELPLEPQDKELVFVSEQGLHVDKSSYSIVNNKVVFRAGIVPERAMEVMIINNIQSQGLITDDLPGVIVDAISTSKGIHLIRHNAPPIKLPAPEFDLSGGEGIKITGVFPYYKIESELAQQIAADKFANFNQQRVVNDGESITITQRIKFKGNIVIMATADFSADLGPGFNKSSGLEKIQTVLGFRTPGQNESDFGRGINGSGEKGFASPANANTNSIAYSGLSTSQSFDILKSNHSAGFIDIVAKMRVTEANISSYGSKLKVGLNIIVIPKLG